MFQQFIHRPVLAIVTSLIIVFLGILAIRTLPVSQFPEISPPRVIVTVAYPGASADVLVKSTLIPLERSINGVPGMKYMISDSTSAGEATIQVIFEFGTDAMVSDFIKQIVIRCAATAFWLVQTKDSWDAGEQQTAVGLQCLSKVRLEPL